MHPSAETAKASNCPKVGLYENHTVGWMNFIQFGTGAQANPKKSVILQPENKKHWTL